MIGWGIIFLILERKSIQGCIINTCITTYKKLDYYLWWIKPKISHLLESAHDIGPSLKDGQNLCFLAIAYRKNDGILSPELHYII